MMTFGEKLSKLRKEHNYTQEQLADILDVSRQSISKWESDIAYPETEKLIKLGKLFGCSMDYLLKDEITEQDGTRINEKETFWQKIKKQFHERKSKTTVFGMPLYHIGREARGFFAIGLRAHGVFSIGLMSRGIFSFGLLSLGAFSVGVLSLGLLALGNLALGLFAIGCIALGILSIGAISIGIVSVGALSVGLFSVGALATGKYIAIGDHARAMIAIGETWASGSVHEALSALTDIDVSHVNALLDENTPTWLSWAKKIYQFFIRATLG